MLTLSMSTQFAPERAGDRVEFAALGGRRLMLAEEALKNHVGHFYEYNRAVVDAHRPLGVETVVAAHLDVSPDVRSAIGAEPVFPQTSWDGIYAHSNPWRRYLSVAHHNYRVYSVMREFLRRRGPFDCVFAPTVTIHHVIGWQALARAELGHNMGRLVLFFRNSIGSYSGSGAPTLSGFKQRIWRHVFKALRPEIATGRILLATDSPQLAAEYELLAGAAPRVFPQPNFVTRNARETPFNPSEPFTFGCLGPARLEKGVDLFQEAIRIFLATCPEANVRFVIQWNHPIHLEDGSLLAVDPLLADDPRVAILNQEMDSAAYEAALLDLDCMVLPYRRASYAARISGVAVEAASAGIPLIFTENTWVADLVETCGVGIALRDEDVSDLVRALIETYRSREELSRQARARAPEARHAHSREAFLRALWPDL